MNEQNLTAFATIKELAKIYPSFSESSLRYWVFNSNKNGLSKCIRRIGRKLVINVREFDSWLDSHREGN